MNYIMIMDRNTSDFQNVWNWFEKGEIIILVENSNQQLIGYS